MTFSFYYLINRVVTLSWRRNLNYLFGLVQHFYCIWATPALQFLFLTSFSYEVFVEVCVYA